MKKFICPFSHTQELLDEALDSVKNVLMQTFKKNLESGGDLTYVGRSLFSMIFFLNILVL